MPGSCRQWNILTGGGDWKWENKGKTFLLEYKRKISDKAKTKGPGFDCKSPALRFVRFPQTSLSVRATSCWTHTHWTRLGKYINIQHLWIVKNLWNLIKSFQFNRHGVCSLGDSSYINFRPNCVSSFQLWSKKSFHIKKKKKESCTAFIHTIASEMSWSCMLKWLLL